MKTTILLLALASSLQVACTGDAQTGAASGGAPGATPGTLVSAAQPGDESAFSLRSDGAWLYWKTMQDWNVSLYKMPITGGDRTLVANDVGADAFLDVADDNIYYRGSEGNVVRRAKTGGAPPESVSAVVLNAAASADAIYWIDGNAYSAADGSGLFAMAHRLPRDGGAEERFFLAKDDGGRLPQNADYLAVVDTTLLAPALGSDTGQAVDAYPLAAPGAGDVVTPVTGQLKSAAYQQVHCQPLVSDGDAAYCARNENRLGGNKEGAADAALNALVKISSDGSTTVLVPNVVIYDLAVDATSIYWVTTDGIWKLPKSGGAAALAVGGFGDDDFPIVLAVDDAAITWVDSRGNIRRLAK
jgi:hypothetical protein